MLILKAGIFSKHQEIIFGFSTKVGPGSHPYYFNLSYSVGDNAGLVKRNRNLFFKKLGLKPENAAWQKQVHGDIIKVIEQPGFAGESDAMITAKRDIGILISTADCTSIYIYDSKNRIIAGVHAGWRSTEKNILLKTLIELEKVFNCSSKDLTVYIGPSICQEHYEVGTEVAEKFNQKYLLPSGHKYLLDIPKINYDTLVEFGVNKKNIMFSKLCTFEMRDVLHSYRREGLYSGRSAGVIAIKDKHES